MATIDDYMDGLYTEKHNLAENLNAKGVSASDAETFSTLVPKVLAIPQEGGGSGNYEDLANKSQINGVELKGNKTSSDLQLQDKLTSGTNIKTINNESLLGSGDIEIKSGISVDTTPIGAMIQLTTNTIPEGWLLCDGRAVSRTTYKKLFAVIGTTFGSGDGSTTFNLPNLKGKVAVGLDDSQTEFNALGKTGGDKSVQLKIKELPSHTHEIHKNFNVTIGGIGGGGSSGIPNAVAGWGSYGNAHWTDIGAYNTGGDQAHNNLQPYIVGNYIIKYDNTVGLVGTVVNNKSTSTTDTYSADYIDTNKANKADVYTKTEIDKLNTYSTEEQVIGTWIDGKPIYRKVIKVLVNAREKTYAHGISNIKEVVRLDGMYNPDANYWYPMTYYSTNQGYSIEYGVDVRGTIYIKLGASVGMNNRYAIVIVEYTKTTDA